MFNSCQKYVIEQTYELQKNKNILELPIEQQVQYANNYLKNIGLVYQKLKRNDETKQLLELTLQQKKLQGKELSVNIFELQDIINKSKTFKNKEKLLNLLAETKKAFDHLLPDEPLIPQIYFVSLELLDNKDKNIKLRSTNNQTIYVFATDPQESPEIPAYTIQNNDYIIFDSNFNEQKAIQYDDVVSLGFSEEFNNDNITTLQDSISNPDSLLINSYSGSGAFITNLYLDKVGFTDPHEAWYKGKSEIHINGIGIYDQNYMSYSVRDTAYINVTNMGNNDKLKPRGIELIVLSRRTIRDHEIITVDKLLKENFETSLCSSFPVMGRTPNGYTCIERYDLCNPTNNSLSHVNVIIFEYDTWPVGKKHEALRVASIDRDVIDGDFIVYRSADQAYTYYALYNISYSYLNDMYSGKYVFENTDEDVDSPYYYEDMNALDHYTKYKWETKP